MIDPPFLVHGNRIFYEIGTIVARLDNAEDLVEVTGLSELELVIGVRTARENEVPDSKIDGVWVETRTS